MSEKRKFREPPRLSRREALVPVDRWTPPRKAAAVEAILGGVVTVSEMGAAHAISIEELAEWVHRHQRAPIEGLRVTRRASWSTAA